MVFKADLVPSLPDPLTLSNPRPLQGNRILGKEHRDEMSIVPPGLEAFGLDPVAATLLLP